jgi:hypothetical protein
VGGDGSFDLDGVGECTHCVAEKSLESVARNLEREHFSRARLAGSHAVRDHFQQIQEIRIIV